MRLRARQSAKRFTEEEFAKRWIIQMEKLVELRQKKALVPGAR
jgi:alpha-1,2-mannosyltransferase